jgi:Zn-finger nucleic acid-binding protein
MSTTLSDDAGICCPHCKINLVMSDRQGIEIDYCPKCRGVWLDRGELDKIIERSMQFQPQTVPEPAPVAAPVPSLWLAPTGQPGGWDNRHDHGRQDSGHDRRDGHDPNAPRRKESFLERLFD